MSQNQKNKYYKIKIGEKMLMIFLFVLCCFITLILGMELLLEVATFGEIKIPIPLYIKLPVFIVLLSIIITKFLMIQ